MTNDFLISIFISIAVIGMLGGIMGSLLYLQKRILVADSISHATLPGIAFGFLISGTKNTLWLFLGALLTSYLSVVLIDFLKRKTKLKQDSILGISLSGFFAFGIVLMSFIQNNGNGEQSGLNSYLFGKAIDVNTPESIASLVLLLVITGYIIINFKKIRAILFDAQFSTVSGLKVKNQLFVISFFTVCTVAISVKAMGVILASSLLIATSAASRYWVNQFKPFILASVFIGVLACISGTYFSLQFTQMPTGPSIVLALFVIVALSVIAGSKRGLYHRLRQTKKRKSKVIAENVLKQFFYLSQNEGEQIKNVHWREIAERNRLKKKDLKLGLKWLKERNLLIEKANFYTLSEIGWEYCKSLVRRHRLWELYLSRALNLEPDHVHQDAELAEHFISPELEKRLTEELDNPNTDPHNKQIP